MIFRLKTQAHFGCVGSCGLWFLNHTKVIMCFQTGNDKVRENLCETRAIWKKKSYLGKEKMKECSRRRE